MRTNILKKFLLNTFWLSIIFHLLLFLYLFLLFPLKEEKKKSPNLFVPSYVFKPTPYKTTSATLQQQSSSKSVTSKKENEIREMVEPSQPKNQLTAPLTKDSLYVKQVEKKNVNTPHETRPKSMLVATQEFMRQSMHHSISAPKDEEPIYLIGENNTFSDPLIKLLGKALSAHFEYPKMAGEFGIRGRVLVRLTLHPGGYFSNVQMVQSSNNQDLDSAALYAVNRAPIVYGADRFIHTPKIFVVGFIFR